MADRTGVRASLAANVGSLGLVLVVQLLSVPVLIAVLGVSDYGHYLVLVAAPAYLALSDLGLVAAGSTALTISMVRDDGRAQAILAAIWSGLVCVAGVLVVAACGVVALVDVSSDAYGPGEARTIVLLYVCYVALLLVSSVFEAVHRAVGLFVQSTMLVAVGRLTDFALGTVVLLVTGSPAAMVAGFIVARAGWMVMMRVLLRSSAPWASFFPVRWNREELARLVRPAGASLALPVGNAALNQGFVLVLGGVLGPVAVVVFTTARTVVNFYRQGVNAISNGLLPILTRASAAGDRQRGEHLVRSATLGLAAIGVPAVVAAAICGPEIIRWWAGGVQPSTSLMTLLAVSVVLDGVWLMRSSLQVSENTHGGMAVCYLLGAAVSLVLVWWATAVWGTVAAAGAVACAQSAFMIAVCARRPRTRTPLPVATVPSVLT